MASFLAFSLAFIIGGGIASLLTFKYLEGDYTPKTNTYGHSIPYYQLMLLERFIHDILIQGNHANNLKMLHKMILTEALSTYREDNKYTLVDWISTCYQEALDEHEMGIGVHLSQDHDTHRPQTVVSIVRKKGNLS